MASKLSYVLLLVIMCVSYVNCLDFDINKRDFAKAKYSGGGHHKIHGGGMYKPVEIRSGRSTFTPSISHSMYGNHHKIGGGLEFRHKLNNHATIGIGAHRHGRQHRIMGGINFRF